MSGYEPSPMGFTSQPTSGNPQSVVQYIKPDPYETQNYGGEEEEEEEGI